MVNIWNIWFSNCVEWMAYVVVHTTPPPSPPPPPIPPQCHTPCQQTDTSLRALWSSELTPQVTTGVATNQTRLLSVSGPPYPKDRRSSAVRTPGWPAIVATQQHPGPGNTRAMWPRTHGLFLWWWSWVWSVSWNLVTAKMLHDLRVSATVFANRVSLWRYRLVPVWNRLVYGPFWCDVIPLGLVEIDPEILRRVAGNDSPNLPLKTARLYCYRRKSHQSLTSGSELSECHAEVNVN